MTLKPQDLKDLVKKMREEKKEWLVYDNVRKTYHEMTTTHKERIEKEFGTRTTDGKIYKLK